MNYQKLLFAVAQKLRDAGFEDAQFEARQLLQEVLGVNALQLLADEDVDLPRPTIEKVQAWVAKREKGYPLAYLSGRRGFYKSVFKVEEGVLIPRPETELVVEIALKRCTPAPKLLADFGCGTGCIGLSLLKEWPQARLIAYDWSEKACALTKTNAEALNLLSRTQVQRGKIKEIPPVPSFELIVANPPYIAVGDKDVQKSVHDFEPHEALYSGADGLDDIRVWSVRAHEVLKPGGILVMEFGATQASAVNDILQGCGFRDIQIHQDLAQKYRVLSAQK